MTLDVLPPELWDKILNEATLKDMWSFQKTCENSQYDRYISSLTGDHASRILLENMFSVNTNVCLIVSGEDTQMKTSAKPRRKPLRERQGKCGRHVSLTSSETSYPLIWADKTNENLHRILREHEKYKLRLRPKSLQAEINNLTLASRMVFRNGRDNRG